MYDNTMMDWLNISQQHDWHDNFVIELKPVLPYSLVFLYWSLAAPILILCVLSALSLKRTKRTPQGARLLSIGLLTYDILFLLLSSVTKVFDINDAYPVWQAARGCQVAAQVIIASMSMERLFVLNWPYVYLRVMTERRINKGCTTVNVVAFLQFVAIISSVCYARGRPLNCGVIWAAYLALVSIGLPFISFICFFKIYKIIRKSEDKHRPMHAIRQYKGTVAAFMVLVNTTISQVAWGCIAVLFFTRTAGGAAQDGFLATVTDWTYLINCIVDPTIFVLWFSETRMELFKLIQGLCPCVKPTIEKLRIEVYQLNFLNEV